MSNWKRQHGWLSTPEANEAASRAILASYKVPSRCHSSSLLPCFIQCSRVTALTVSQLISCQLRKTEDSREDSSTFCLSSVSLLCLQDKLQFLLLTDSWIFCQDNTLLLCSLREPVIRSQPQQHSSAPQIVPIHYLQYALCAKVTYW